MAFTHEVLSQVIGYGLWKIGILNQYASLATHFSWGKIRNKRIILKGGSHKYLFQLLLPIGCRVPNN